MWKILVFLCLVNLANPIYAQEHDTQPISLFNGQDLTNWRITDFGTQGQVRVENGKLLLGMGDGATGVTWNGDFAFPTMDYEVSLKAMRVSGNDFFCGLTFPVNEDHLTLIVGGWSGMVIGLSSLDGYDASENETTTSKSFQKQRWYDIRLRVADNIIQVWIDDREMINCDTTDRELSLRPEVLLSRPFGIASWFTTAALKDIELRLLQK
jgi:hypothetical protein